MKTELLTFDFSTRTITYCDDRSIMISWSPSVENGMGGVVVSGSTLEEVIKKFNEATILFTFVANIQRQQQQLDLLAE